MRATAEEEEARTTTTTEQEDDRLLNDDRATTATTASGTYRRFFRVFLRSRSGLAILIVSTVLAVGIGTVLGLLPATLANRYASLNHGSTEDCREVHHHQNHTHLSDKYDIYLFLRNYEESASPHNNRKSAACAAGSDDAKYAATWSNAASCALTLVCNPVLGSVSDAHGRRPILLLSLALSVLPAVVFVLLLQRPTMHPVWYYCAYSLTGIVNYLSIVFAYLTDVIPSEYRAPSYGLLLSGFFGGFAFAPSLALLLPSDVAVAYLSMGLIVSALVLAILFLPETLRSHVEYRSRQQQRERLLHLETTIATSAIVALSENIRTWLWQTATRPVREVSILNRNWSIRLLAVGSFFAAMVFASDSTLFVYYIEEKFDITKFDIACMTLVLGISGILVQAALLQPMISLLGERGLLVTAYGCGTLHNLLYGLARTKGTIYAGLVTSQFTKTNFPLLSSLASRHVEEREQGRMQGALFATNAVANALGPLSMEYVYHYTKNKPGFGSGFFFVYAGGLYAIGTVIVALIPAVEERVELHPVLEDGSTLDRGDDGVEPLLTDATASIDFPDILQQGAEGKQSCKLAGPSEISLRTALLATDDDKG